MTDYIKIKFTLYERCLAFLGFIEKTKVIDYKENKEIEKPINKTKNTIIDKIASNDDDNDVTVPFFDLDSNTKTKTNF